MSREEGLSDQPAPALNLCWVAAVATHGLADRVREKLERSGLEHQVLGRGTQGVVRLLDLGDEKVAVKKVASPLANKGAGSNSFEKNSPAEVEIHKKLTEKNMGSDRTGVLPLLALFASEGGYVAVMPVFEFDLRKAMSEIVRLSKSNDAAETELYKKVMFGFFCSMVVGLKEFQTGKVVHRDIKPENISFSTEFSQEHAQLEWKAFDYGISSPEKKDTSEDSTFEGTPEYASPESLSEKAYLYSSDVWAVGHILFEMMSVVEPMARVVNNQFARAVMYEENAEKTLASAASVRGAREKHEDAQYSQASYFSRMTTSITTSVSSFFKNKDAVFLEQLSQASNFHHCLLIIANAMHNPQSELRPDIKSLELAVKKLETFVTPATKEDYDHFLNAVKKSMEKKDKVSDVDDFFTCS